MTEIKNGKCTCKDCEEKRANEQKHLNSPFYQEVRAYTEMVEIEQILKGAEKYPEPFNPDSWTDDELSNHGMQELRDGQVYITGMRDRMRKLRRSLNDKQTEIERLKAEVKSWEQWHDAIIKSARGIGIIIDKRV